MHCRTHYFLKQPPSLFCMQVGIYTGAEQEGSPRHQAGGALGVLAGTLQRGHTFGEGCIMV
jgi:hypothetical protein